LPFKLSPFLGLGRDLRFQLPFELGAFFRVRLTL